MEEMRDKLLELFPEFHYAGGSVFRYQLLAKEHGQLKVIDVDNARLKKNEELFYAVNIWMEGGDNYKTPDYDEAVFYDFDYVVEWLKENLPKLSDNSDESVQNTSKSHENAPECVS